MVKAAVSRALEAPFFLQLLSLSFLVLIVLSFKPPFYTYGEILGTFGYEENTFEDFIVQEPGFLENDIGVSTAGIRQILVEDDTGKKVVVRKRDSVVYYTVKPGDNIWKIAHKFGVKVSSILWANNLTAKQTLPVGTKLKIPPTDGIFYTVKRGETLGEIARNHQIDIQKIRAYNNIQKDLIKAGQELFLPGAKKTYIARKPSSGAKRAGRTFSQNTQTPALKSVGIHLLRPTKGILTQGYHYGHYALDIANKLNTPIYAAADGVVKIARNGWNYGYGNYIVIDHGNNVETLYGHNSVLKVSPGQQVKAGQLIALMGHSGRVFGPTGIHLHFELRIRGRKVNPYHYFR